MRGRAGDEGFCVLDGEKGKGVLGRGGDWKSFIHDDISITPYLFRPKLVSRFRKRTRNSCAVESRRLGHIKIYSYPYQTQKGASSVGDGSINTKNHYIFRAQGISEFPPFTVFPNLSPFAIPASYFFFLDLLSYSMS